MNDQPADLADHLVDIAEQKHNLSYERILLGLMMASPSAIDEALDVDLKPDGFYHPKHVALFQSIVAARQAGVPTEPNALGGWLADRGELANVGGAAYLIELMEAVPTSVGSPRWYAEQLLDMADRRGMLTALAQVAQAGRSGADAEHLAAMAETVIRAAAPRTRESGFVPLGDFAQIGMRDIEMRKSQPRGLMTGFVDLDRLLGGLRPGQLVVIAARPGMGKSTLGLDIARNVSIGSGLVTAFVSLEMTVQELFDRCLSAEGRIPHIRVRDGDLDDFDWQRASKVLGPMSEAPLLVTDEVGQTVLRIANKLRRQARRGLHLAIIDHLGLLRDPSVAKQGKQQEIAQIARDLKELAKSLGIPIIAMAQLNRDLASRTDKVPQLTDLRESGEIEQSADIVIMLHRDDYYDKESPRAGEADFVVLKNRGGPTDTITVAAQLHFSRFVDMALPADMTHSAAS